MNNGGLPYRVETMQWVDVPDVMAIESQSFTLPWSEYTYHHELLENTHSYYFVVRRLDQPAARKSASWWNRLWGKDEPAAIVGYGGFWFIVDEAHISTIASHPDWRGRGVGELLLLWMIEQAIELGAKIVTLEVRVTNSVAQQLYRKYGFEKVGRRPRYYRDNNEDADLMTVAQVDRAAYQTRLKQLRAALEDRLRREVVRGSGVHV
jgi:ribosomal-protein-alanine N-acetyltransferase